MNRAEVLLSRLQDIEERRMREKGDDEKGKDNGDDDDEDDDDDESDSQDGTEPYSKDDYNPDGSMKPTGTRINDLKKKMSKGS